MFCHLVDFPSSLVNLFNAQLVVEELWLRAFIAEVVVVVGGCQPYPLAHSTHVFHSSPSRTLPWSVHSTTIFGLFCSHAGVFGAFLDSRRFSSSPHELLSTHELQNRVLPVVCASMGKNGAVFLHAGPPLSVIFLAGSVCLPTRRYSSVWGAHSELRAVIFHP